MIGTAKSQVHTRESRLVFEQRVEESFKQAFRVAYRLTGNIPDAQDLVQETFVRAYRFFHRYDRSLPWIYRIMSNTNVDMIRRKGKLKWVSLDTNSLTGRQAAEIADDTLSPSSIVEETMSDEVQCALNSINAEFKMAVILSDVEALSYEEIALSMGTSVGTVRSRIHRGRIQIKNFLLSEYPKIYGGNVNVL
jgi:RNA polymerase sigma-70 factor (ECF subfamily)